MKARLPLMLVTTFATLAAVDAGIANAQFGGLGAGGGIGLGDEFEEALTDALRSRSSAGGPENVPDLTDNRTGRANNGQQDSWLMPPPQKGQHIPQLLPVAPGWHGHPPLSIPPMTSFGHPPMASPWQGLPMDDHHDTHFTPVGPGFNGNSPPFRGSPFGPPPARTPKDGLPWHDVFGRP